MLKILLPFLLFFTALNSEPGFSQPKKQTVPSILVFSKTEGYRHASIPAGIEALREITNQNGYLFRHTEDSRYFSEDSLTTYDAVVFLNTTKDVLNSPQQEALKKFIRQGGGFAGIHSASDTEYNWAWYGRMVGAYFKSHPRVQQALIHVRDSTHSATRHLPAIWHRTDEWYNFRDIQPHIQVLATIDESSYRGGANGEYHPIAWYHEFEGGRVFYTAGGHTSESYSELLFRQHLLGGIRYVVGL